MTITATDLFCGAGGSSLGASNAGVTVQMAANHWPKAIEVHQKNFPDTRHDCADVSQVDFRRYPASDILMASPECTNHSASRGVSRRQQNPGLWDAPDPAAEKSRATMWDVHRYIEVHHPSVAVIENVVEARSWIYWSSWWQAFADAGYTAQTLSINSMHVPAGLLGDKVPQSRDRLYVVATRRGINLDLEMRPWAYCETCNAQTRARQQFKSSSRPFGRYKQSWNWLCGMCSSLIELQVAPASQAIDWSIPSQRIGERSKPLAGATLMRIRNGLTHYGIQADNDVLFQAPTTNSSVSTPSNRPDAFYLRNFGNGSREAGNMLHPTSKPFGAMTAHDHTSLVVPYYRTGRALPVTQPIGTLTTHDRYGLATGVTLDDCTFRMLEPHEVGKAMGFPDSYHVEGTKKDRVRLYGNAVTPPVAEFLLGRVVDALSVAA